MRSEFEEWLLEQKFIFVANPSDVLIKAFHDALYSAWQASAARHREVMEKALEALQRTHEYVNVELQNRIDIYGPYQMHGKYASEMEDVEMAEKAIASLKQALSEMGE